MSIDLELNKPQFKEFLLEIIPMLKELFKFLKLSIGNAYVSVNIGNPRDIKALDYNGILVLTNSTEIHHKSVIFKYLLTLTLCNHLTKSQFCNKLFQLKQLFFLKTVLHSQFTGTDNHYLMT